MIVTMASRRLLHRRGSRVFVKAAQTNKCGVALLESRMDAIESRGRSSRWSLSTALGDHPIEIELRHRGSLLQFDPIEGHTRPFGKSCRANRSNLFVELVDTPTDNKRARCSATAPHVRAMAMSSNWLR